MRKGKGHAGWIPELDGLRVLMIFVVSWYHIWQQSWLTPVVGSYSLDYLLRSGYVWVDGTVLLSAFLLFLPYVRSFRQGRSLPDPKEFYYKRARRILPPYYFILLITLLVVVLPYNLYYSPQYMVKDLATHLTFTFPFFYDTYVATPLGAAAWTLAIEVQAYLIFLLIARAALKKPAATLGIMCLVCWGFRLWCVWSLNEYNMVVNQLLNFGDVYALGILLAFAYTALREHEFSRKGRILLSLGALIVFAAGFWALLRMMRVQAASSAYSADTGFAGMIADWLGQRTTEHYAVVQRNQMLYRPAFALLFGALLLSAPFAPLPLRKLLGNPVTRFLSGVSMNYYLIHQVIIVHMRRIGFPPSVSDTPNQVGEQPWQTQYVLWAFGLSLLAAILITYLVEKPAGKLLDYLRGRKSGSRGKDPRTGAAPGESRGDAIAQKKTSPQGEAG